MFHLRKPACTSYATPQVERCISLLRTSPAAARRFYQLAVIHLSPAEVTKFILAILSAVVQCVECEGVSSDGVTVGGSDDGDGESEAETNSKGTVCSECVHWKGCGCVEWE